MDNNDSTLIDTPILEEAVGAAPAPDLGDLDQLPEHGAEPALGDLTGVEDGEVVAADEAVPVLSELVSPPPPSEIKSRLSEPTSELDAANQDAPQDAMSAALDDLLGSEDDLPVLDEALAQANIPDDALQLDPGSTLEAEAPAQAPLEDAPAPQEAAPEATEAAPEETPSEAPSEPTAAPEEAATATAAPAEEHTLENALDQLLGEAEDAALPTEDEAMPPPEAADPVALDLAGQDEDSGPSGDDSAPLDVLAPAAAAAAGALAGRAGAESPLRQRIQHHLAQRVEAILNETVAVLVRDLEDELLVRVEAALEEALEAALPRITGHLLEELRPEIKQRLDAQIPQLIDELLGRGEGENRP